MHFKSTLVAAAACLSLANAAPAEASASASVDTSAKLTSEPFKIKTQLKPGSKNMKQFQGLYMVADHSGAGENFAAFTRNKKQANTFVLQSGDNPGAYSDLRVKGGLSGTSAAVTTGGCTGSAYYAWQPAMINFGKSFGNGAAFGYSQNPYGYQLDLNFDPATNKAANQAGFMVCYAGAGVPQLFIKNPDKKNKKPTANCADVWLLTES